uniref:Uncharacterized protein n=1 Tax=Rhizophora mucronata TaxID=61149 RepID=A0A2P2IHL5_RHIMU
MLQCFQLPNVDKRVKFSDAKLFRYKNVD